MKFAPSNAAALLEYRAAARRAGLIFAAGTTVFTLRDDGRLLGFCGLSMQGARWTVKNIYVLPEYRLRGHYRRMLTELLAIAHAAGIRTLNATMTHMSAPLWRDLGAVVLSERPDIRTTRMKLDVAAARLILEGHLA